MKSTLLKISVSQDGLLPQETAEIATLEFPTLPKKLLKALGFERVDSKTYVGVLPVFINLGEKEQEIEIELGVTLPEMRKKIIEIVKTPARLIAVADEKKAAVKAPARKKATAPVEKEPAAAKKTPAPKKAPAAKSKAAPKKAASSTKKTTAKSTAKTSTAKARTTKSASAKPKAKAAAKTTTTKAKRAKKG